MVKILHLSKTPKDTAMLWKEIADRFDKPVEMSIAVDAREVESVWREYDFVVVPTSCDWDEMVGIGVDESKLLLEHQSVPQKQTARKSK